MKKLLILLVGFFSLYGAEILPVLKSDKVLTDPSYYNKSINKTINYKFIDSNLLNIAIFHHVNIERKKKGLSPLKYSNELSKFAEFHSDEMCQYEFTGHQDKDNNNFHERLVKHGLVGSIMSENCATSFGLEYNGGGRQISFNGKGKFKDKGEPIKIRTYLGAAKNIVLNFMNSKGHRDNILHKNLKSIGIGTSFYLNTKFNNMLTIKTTLLFKG